MDRVRVFGVPEVLDRSELVAITRYDDDVGNIGEEV